MKHFMGTQEILLMRQIEFIRHCGLWKPVAGDIYPRPPEEFRTVVPLTTYDDYREIFMNKREDLLPSKVKIWAHTTGSTGQAKWIPYTEDFYRRRGEFFLAAGFLSSETGKSLPLKPGDIFLYTVAPPPYGSGVGVQSSIEQFGLKVLPPMEEAKIMTFTERVVVGFKMALDEGRIDVIAGITSVLVGIGKMFGTAVDAYLASVDSRPETRQRIEGGKERARRENRNLLPRDIFSPKVITCSGADATLFADTIEHLWGKRPNECYGFTEAGLFAVQPYGCAGMVLAPDVAYLEFVPEEVYNDEKPVTVLVDELVEGLIYEPVITNLYGGCVFRYRSGDLIEILSLKNPEKNINIPTIRFFGRADNVINLSGVTRLNERACWKILEGSGISYNGWTVEKEYRGEEIFIHFYIETALPKQHVLARVGEAAARVIDSFDEVPEILGYNPIDVTVLPEGTFAAYRSKREEEGADLGQIKPLLVNPKPHQLEMLRHTGAMLRQEQDSSC
jgi:phenylacetate-coenzyme A ligase PaaK-like adenylate-forming protein